MKLYNNYHSVQLNNSQSVVTIGMFDSLHLGHQSVIQKVLELASNNLDSIVITFSNSPATYFQKQEYDDFIFTIEDKIKQFERLGVDHLIVVPFDELLSSYDAKAFVEDILINQLKINSLVLGYDNHFGKNREGSVALINTYYSDRIQAFSVNAVENDQHEIISSSLIKSTLGKGLVELIPSYLGRDYYLKGEIVQGAQLGRQLGFKTANILLNKNLITPALGVYAVMVELKGKNYKAVTNIGKRPSVTDSLEIVVETHIFDFDEEVYGEEICLFFKKKIRDEQKFTSLDALKTQISKDIELAKRILA